MRKFIERALAKVSRMDESSIRGILQVLSEENDRLETVLDSMLDGIIVCDAVNVPILFNKAAERLLPVSTLEFYDRPVWESVLDESIASFLSDTFRGEDTVIDREFVLDIPGATRILSISATPLVKEGRIRGTLLHIEDTTEKRTREAQLRRAESLASLTTLAAGVAHEIKNPLGAISIHVQLMRKALKGRGDEVVERYLGIVDEEIDRLNRIVVDFLFAVRPMDIVPINDDLNGLVEELSAFLRPEAENARVALVESLDPMLPLLPFDKRYIKQALLNLMNNAIAAMPDGGTLSLSTKFSENGAIVTVSDTGTGIGEEHIGKIFEPYFTTKDNGTGLGLTITYKIAREHGGDISVKSRKGSGSAFTLTLPIPQKGRKLITADEPERDAREAVGDGRHP